MGWMTVLSCLFIIVIALCFGKQYKEGYKDVKVDKSEIAGRGVFAQKDFLAGELIEACPYISDDCDKITVGIIGDYLFKADDKCACAFGFCSLYNHSANNNATFHSDVENKLIVITAVRDIKKGDEITIHYGDDYWSVERHKES